MEEDQKHEVFRKVQEIVEPVSKVDGVIFFKFEVHYLTPFPDGDPNAVENPHELIVGGGKFGTPGIPKEELEEQNLYDWIKNSK